MTANADVNYAFSLSLFDRATAVSKNFKYYRAKRVVYTYLPDYITFQSGAGAVSLPQVSMLMNRTGDTSLWTPAEYDAQGAVPKQFNKKMVVAYTPNIVQSIQYISALTGVVPFIGNVGSRPVYGEWIATGTYGRDVNIPAGSVTLSENNNQMLYQGHSMLWSVTSTAPGEPALGTCFCEVEWEFKDPLFQSPSSVSQAPVPATTAGGV